MTDNGKTDALERAPREQSTDPVERAIRLEIDAAEYQREAERLRAMLDETRSRLVEVTAKYDEQRRELAQVLASERGVRRLVIRAGLDDQPYLSVEEVRAALDGLGAPYGRGAP